MNDVIYTISSWTDMYNKYGTYIPSNYLKITKENYKDLIKDVELIKEIKNFFKTHKKASNCFVGSWMIVDNELTPATKRNVKKFQTEIFENLEEDIEKHETLNPKLWNEDGTLKEEVRDKILQIADSFMNDLKQDGIKFDLKDIRIVGSNCSYNYTKDSDLDVHLIADSSSLDCPDDLYPLLYSSYRSIFNKNLDIDFYGIPVEIYVEVE